MGTISKLPIPVLLASSRPDGNTRELAQLCFPQGGAEFIDLSALRIGYYSYTGEYEADDFLPLIERLIDREIWIIATPLHWYTMSAQAKTFIDRFSDLISIRKDLGRLLRGKKLAVICTGEDVATPASFDAPFALSCQYLGMSFEGTHYAQFDGRTPVAANIGEVASAFGTRILSMASD